LHQFISLIKILIKIDDHDKLQWIAHLKVFKHIKNVYLLEQRAKSIMNLEWQHKSQEQSMFFFSYACDRFHLLMKSNNNFFFKTTCEEDCHANSLSTCAVFDVKIHFDYVNENEVTKVSFESFTVNEYMNDLLTVWELNWHKILQLEKQILEVQTWQTKIKREAKLIETRKKTIKKNKKTNTMSTASGWIALPLGQTDPKKATV
jgi:hypothetical protein